MQSFSINSMFDAHKTGGFRFMVDYVEFDKKSSVGRASNPCQARQMALMNLLNTNGTIIIKIT